MSYDPQNVKEFIKSKRFSGLCIDIGCYRFYYTDLLRKTARKVLYFDPLVNKKAVWSHGGKALFVYQNQGMSYVIPDDKKGNVILLTLKDVLYKENAEFVKVDTEGAEIEVLKGAPFEKISSWLIEIHNENHAEIAKILLEPMRYRLRWLSKNHVFASSLIEPEPPLYDLD